MAQNKLTDLNNHLFAQLERLNDEELKPEDIQKEVSRSKAITSVAAQIVNSNRLTLEALKLVKNGDYRQHELPDTLGLNIKNKI